LFGLERNWRGPLISNGNVEATLTRFQSLERAASPQILLNWRFQQALYPRILRRIRSEPFDSGNSG
jgi:hypothetical protein